MADEQNAIRVSRTSKAVRRTAGSEPGPESRSGSEEVARASANLLKQNAETFQNACRFGLDTATSVMGRSTEQFGRTLGLSGDGVQEATERSARNAQTILYTGTAAARVMGGMSQEYFQMIQHQVEKNVNHMNQFWACRTPQHFAAVQSDMLRETIETGLECSRRIADMSLKMAEETGKQIKQNMDEIRR